MKKRFENYTISQMVRVLRIKKKMTMGAIASINENFAMGMLTDSEYISQLSDETVDFQITENEICGDDLKEVKIIIRYLEGEE